MLDLRAQCIGTEYEAMNSTCTEKDNANYRSLRLSLARFHHFQNETQRLHGSEFCRNKNAFEHTCGTVAINRSHYITLSRKVYAECIKYILCM